MRRFTEQDQERFARLSGDWNPMHLDPVAARRTQAGAPVVHGVHLTLWTLDTLIRDGVVKGAVASVQAVFNKFVYLNALTEIRVVRASDDAIEHRPTGIRGARGNRTLSWSRWRGRLQATRLILLPRRKAGDSSSAALPFIHARSGQTRRNLARPPGAVAAGGEGAGGGVGWAGFHGAVARASGIGSGSPLAVGRCPL